MAMAAVFLAQATNTPLSLVNQISLLIVAMLTSKGASGGGRLHHAGRDNSVGAWNPVGITRDFRRYRSVHERMPRTDKFSGQRGRDGGHQPLEEGIDGRDTESKSLPPFLY